MNTMKGMVVFFVALIISIIVLIFMYSRIEVKESGYLALLKLHSNCNDVHGVITEKLEDLKITTYEYYEVFQEAESKCEYKAFGSKTTLINRAYNRSSTLN